MTDILLVDGYHGTNWNLVLAKGIISQGFSVCICTNNIAFYKYYRTQNIDCEFISSGNILSFLSNKRVKGIADFKDFSATEYSYYRLPEWYNKTVCIGYQKSIRKILDKREPKIIFQGQGGELLRRMFYKEATERGILSLFSGESFLKSKLSFYQDEHKTPFINHEGSQTLNLKVLLNEIVSSKKVIKYSSTEIDIPIIPKWKKLFYGLMTLNYHPFVTSLAHKFLMQKVYMRQLAFQLDNNYQKDLGNETFFFFPLNVPAESELFIRNPRFSDQLDTLKEISVNLPDGEMLYVKQHPGISGVISEEVAKELESIPNIKLIKTEYNTFDIVKKSKGVIMVSSSVGFETYTLGKPVIVLGYWPYTQLGDFIKIDKVDDLPEAVEKATNYQASISPIDFMKKIELRSFEGNLHMNNDMINKVAYSLGGILEKL